MLLARKYLSALNFLQNYFCAEIHRGFCGIGDYYSLRSKFGKLLRDKESIPILECYSPQNIVVLMIMLQYASAQCQFEIFLY